MTSEDKPLEIERRYLLESLPRFDEIGRGDITILMIEQGYYTDEDGIDVRLRQQVTVFDPDSDDPKRMTSRFIRTVKSGTTMVRTEVENELTKREFDRVWPTTIDRRLHKKRYKIKAGDACWEIDDFLDRDLVLAEIEIPDELVVPELPSWLSAVLVREVTDEPAYLNINLAR